MTMQAELAAVGAQGGRGCPSPAAQLVIYQTGRPVLEQCAVHTPGGLVAPKKTRQIAAVASHNGFK